jgi:hypothetical protein
MDHATYAQDRINHHDATAFARELELRRRIAERGETITPQRPAVSPLHRLGTMLRDAFHFGPGTPAAVGR